MTEAAKLLEPSPSWILPRVVAFPYWSGCRKMTVNRVESLAETIGKVPQNG
jgi:hypothetical protein